MSVFNVVNEYKILNFDKSVLSIYEIPFKKIRIGSEYDCGFVICNEIKSDILISYGIYNNFLFENDYLNLNKNINSICFYKNNNIDSNINSNIFTIENNCIDQYIFLNKFKNIFLKMDIMGKEIEWLKNISIDNLNNISQIAIKIHLNQNGGFSDERYEILKKLSKTHYLVHIKGNNYSDLILINDIIIPETIECLYIRKNELDNPQKILFISPTDIDNVNTLDKPSLKFKIPIF